MEPQSTIENTFLSPSEERNFALIVENAKLWVSREVLSMYSPVFKKMFYGNFHEATQNEIELPEKRKEELIEFLRCLFFCPTRRKVDSSNIFAMLKLSDEYDVDDLKNRCKRFLEQEVKKMKAGNKDVLTYTIHFARYELTDLLKICIPYAATLPVDVINEHRLELPSATVAAIFEAKARRLQLETKKHSTQCIAVKCTCCYCNSNQAYSCRTCARKVCSKCADKQCGGFHRSDCENHEALLYDRATCLCGYEFREDFLTIDT